MFDLLIKNARIVNEGRTFDASLVINGGRIHKIIEKNRTPLPEEVKETLDAGGRTLIPGVIDDQVHFREPGLTHKADIFSESRAAIAGGITSFMEMPNTVPQTTTIEALEAKYDLAAQNSAANYGFYLGATNDNIDEIRKLRPGQAPGIKIFMGASTGNMLVDDEQTLAAIFSESPVLIATHCEDEATIRKRSEQYREKYGEKVPVHCHPEIRNGEACFLSSSKAVDLAIKHKARLHILHISTARELKLFNNMLPLDSKLITAEVCVHHLWFSDKDYKEKGTHIKWNPAVKTEADREGLRAGLLDNHLDVIATDHAPHTLEEKANTYFKAPSGGPLVQHSLPAMLELGREGLMELPFLVEKMCHAPARIFKVKDRGFIRQGYYADLVILGENEWKVEKGNILYKCGWSPFEGQTFQSRVDHTILNGQEVYRWDDQKKEHVFADAGAAMRLEYNP